MCVCVCVCGACVCVNVCVCIIRLWPMNKSTVWKVVIHSYVCVCVRARAPLSLSPPVQVVAELVSITVRPRPVNPFQIHFSQVSIRTKN